MGPCGAHVGMWPAFRAEPGGHGAEPKPNDSGRIFGCLSRIGLYLNAGCVWDGGGFSGPPSSVLLLDTTLRSPEYLCWGWASSVTPSPAASSLQTHLPHPELNGSPEVERPSWRRHCCRSEADPCNPRPHMHSHGPWRKSRALLPAAAPACRAPCPAARAARASAPPGSPASGAGPELPSPPSSHCTSCCSHRTKICSEGTRVGGDAEVACPPRPPLFNPRSAPPLTRLRRSSHWPQLHLAPAPGWASGGRLLWLPRLQRLQLTETASDIHGLHQQRVPEKTEARAERAAWRRSWDSGVIGSWGKGHGRGRWRPSQKVSRCHLWAGPLA